MEAGVARLTWQGARPANVVRHVQTRDVSALADGRGKWQATTPIGGAGDLPAADQVILPATCVGKESLALANRQFVDEVIDPDVVAIEFFGAVRDFGGDRIIIPVGIG